MTVVSIMINDLSNPAEVQAWLDANPSVSIQFVQIQINRFYIFYN